jgi:hypothetical protein
MQLLLWKMSILVLEKETVHPLEHNSEMEKREVPRVSSAKICAESKVGSPAIEKDAVPIAVAVFPSGNTTLSGFVVGEIFRLAVNASVWRSNILSEPESAQAKVVEFSGKSGRDIVVADSDDDLIREKGFKTLILLVLL